MYIFTFVCLYVCVHIHCICISYMYTRCSINGAVFYSLRDFPALSARLSASCGSAGRQPLKPLRKNKCYLLRVITILSGYWI